MAEPDLYDLMFHYARRGLDDWNRNAKSDLRTRASDCLRAAIVEHEWEVIKLLTCACNGGVPDQYKFIPMPYHGHNGIERCFFLPMHVSNGQAPKMTFDLFLLVKEMKCLAFRFEPADPPEHAHNYSHVQPSRKLLRKTLDPIGIPAWIPESYPAFPVPSSKPLKVFLSMATAVHGYSGGIEMVLQDIFQKASRSVQTDVYLEKLRTMLE